MIRKNVVRVIRIFDVAGFRLASVKDNVFSNHQIFFFLNYQMFGSARIVVMIVGIC